MKGIKEVILVPNWYTVRREVTLKKGRCPAALADATPSLPPDDDLSHFTTLSLIPSIITPIQPVSFIAAHFDFD